jgi:hypothetical protein
VSLLETGSSLFIYALAICAVSSLAMYVVVRRMGILR